MTIDQYALAAGQIRRAQAEFVEEMNEAEIFGRSRWCAALRSMQNGDPTSAGMVPIEMLKEFATAAPSAYLHGYVLGLLSVCLKPDNFSRESARAMLMEAGLNLNSSSVCRGALFGCGFATVVLHRGGRA